MPNPVLSSTLPARAPGRIRYTIDGEPFDITGDRWTLEGQPADTHPMGLVISRGIAELLEILGSIITGFGGGGGGDGGGGCSSWPGG